MPRVTVLQLDTHFHRPPGDVGCPATYAMPPQIIRIPGAVVGQIVTDRPQDIKIAPFTDALGQASGDIIATSCGFLSYWQTHLATQTKRPFVSSALTALDTLHNLPPDAVMIVTFDAQKLSRAHLGAYPQYASSIVGLPTDGHLRAVIQGDEPTLDAACAAHEVRDTIAAAITPNTRHILFECTNLPPYKSAIRAEFGLPITDILTQLDAACPGCIAPEWL